ncbi:glycoside hydrolase family 71 protein [Agrocybe pediades]|nr:glycoside hydrolase family 71 protein [Agrocybe pediades]
MSTEAAKRNYVFAHFMVGNTYPYTVDDWYADIKLAASHGIDGFVLNVGREGWQKQRSIDCFAAAKRLPESIPGGSAGDVQLFRDYLSATSKSARMFRHPRTNGVVVSTFSGENSNFGQGNLENGWQYLKNELNKIVPVYFIPSFFISPARYRSIPAMDGAFNWNGGWPLQLNPWTERSQVVNAKLDSDYSHLENLTDGRTFMAAVSPWFFTWIYRGDDWLFVRRWEQLIEMRDSIDMAQIISWNGEYYGESHYIGPIKGAQPNSQAWVDGFPHEAWMTLNQYYAKAFQTGKYPIIEKERIFMWVRPHPKDASSPDSVPRPDNWQLTDDTAWVVVFANKPGSVTLSTQEDESDKTTHQVNPGVTKLSFPVKVGQGMKATLYRDNKAVVTCYPRDFRFNGQPPVYNFNAYVTMSP